MKVANQEQRCADLVGYSSAIAACAIGRCLASNIWEGGG